MQFTLAPLDATPIYLQLRQQIISAIARGELRPGDKLPAVRTLAQDLGINLHTVAKTYQVLSDEGFLVNVGRRGVFVAEAMTNPLAGLSYEMLVSKLAHLETEYFASGGTLDEVIKAVTEAYAMLHGGEHHV